MKDFQKLEDVVIETHKILYPGSLPERVKKLQSEFDELMVELNKNTLQDTGIMGTSVRAKAIDELGDVVFVLATIASKLNVNLYDCLHGSLQKAVIRMKDPDYLKQK